MTIDLVTATDLRDIVETFRDLLKSHQQRINRLNVYPVPDGDTGTNMALTVASVCEEFTDIDQTDMKAVCTAVSHGSLMGARGNSGVILSQILRGIAGIAAEHPAGVGPDAMVAALEAAADAAYGAVMKPVEGTILTVMRGAAIGAGAAGEGATLTEVFDAARVAGADALAKTPELLSVLADAGVVDAGGTGLLLLVDAALSVVAGRELPDAPEVDDVADALAEAHDHSHGGIADLRYEVMYLLDAPDSTIDAFKDVWQGIGDSIVVVGGDGLWNCHIHTDDIGAAIEAGIDAGRPRRIRVTDLLEQVEEERWVTEAGGVSGAVASEPVETAVVAVAAGDGISRLLHSLGVQQIVAGGQSMNPSTADLLAAVEACPADGVVILPNNSNIIPVAEQVATQTDKTVFVVPTRGVVEAVAALVSYDPFAEAEAVAEALREGAEAVIAGEVTRAVRDSSCEVGPIVEGDWLGIAREGIRAVASSLVDATTRLLDDLVTDEHEIVTLVEGEGSSVAATRQITEWLDEHRVDVAVEVHAGGQPLYPYFIGVE
ncbi:MAG TPA: DAK2 domain-containing protein [Acidimicrobiales bacterium]|nr:DAK2 domain-containing protein [Acidimicrobiales bacterium]